MVYSVGLLQFCRFWRSITNFRFFRGLPQCTSIFANDPTFYNVEPLTFAPVHPRFRTCEARAATFSTGGCSPGMEDMCTWLEKQKGGSVYRDGSREMECNTCGRCLSFCAMHTNMHACVYVVIDCMLRSCFFFVLRASMRECPLFLWDVNFTCRCACSCACACVCVCLENIHTHTYTHIYNMCIIYIYIHIHIYRRFTTWFPHIHNTNIYIHT